MTVAVAAIACGLLFGAYSNAAAATAVPFGPDLAANGWRLMTFPNRTPARFTAQGAGTVLVNADRAVAVLWRQTRAAERAAATAQWRWRVDRSVGPTDLARKGGDDRALAIYFVFSGAAGQSNPIDLSRIMRSGQATVLMYVWGGDRPKGVVLPSPYLGENARSIVLKTADDPLGSWSAERVDLNADHRKAFGAAAPALVAVAISSDSDDTSGMNDAAVAELVINP